MMTLPVERWYKAIPVRHSRRNFIDQPINREIITCLQKTINDFTPFNDVRAVLVTEPIDDIFKGAIGPYGKVKGARAYMAFVGDEKSTTVNEHIGYLGEGLVLEAVSLSLSTCWISGSFKSELVSRHIDLGVGEKVYAVTPIGYAPVGKRLAEKMLSVAVGSHKRKDISAIAVVETDYLPDWAETALQAARIAPSAINRQPWIFRIEKSGVTLSIDKPSDDVRFSRCLDCGIAMLHFELAANFAGVKGHWEYLDHPQVAKFVLD